MQHDTCILCNGVAVTDAPATLCQVHWDAWWTAVRPDGSPGSRGLRRWAGGAVAYELVTGADHGTITWAIPHAESGVVRGALRIRHIESDADAQLRCATVVAYHAPEELDAFRAAEWSVVQLSQSLETDHANVDEGSANGP